MPHSPRASRQSFHNQPSTSGTSPRHPPHSTVHSRTFHPAPSGHPQPHPSHHRSEGHPQIPLTAQTSARSADPVGLKRSGGETVEGSPTKRRKMTPLVNLKNHIECFQEILSRVPVAYDFVPSTHPWKKGPDTIYLKTAKFLPNKLRVAMIAAEGALPNLEKAVSYIKSAPLNLPTYAEMVELEEFRLHFQSEGPALVDQPKKLMSDLKARKERIISLANLALATFSPPSPSEFGTSRHWKEMRLNEEHAIYCHRPACRQPLVPVKLMHRAFSNFFHIMNQATPPTASQLERFRVAATALGNKLNATLRQEATRDGYIGPILREVFPETDIYKWTMQNRVIDGQAIHDLVYGYVTLVGGKKVVVPFIMIEITLLPVARGDGYMQVSRMHNAFIRSTPSISLSGAPCFAISISGSDLKVCGAFAESYGVEAECDLSEDAAASCEISLNDVEPLAKVLFALGSAVECLSVTPLRHTPRRISNTPVIFDTFLDEDGNTHPLVFGRPFDESRCSIYYTVTPANCMVKLTFRPYGSDVHKILHAADLAPKLVGASNIPALEATATVMARLLPPAKDADGWMTLHDLFRVSPELVLNHQDAIFKKLELIVEVLKKQKVVHGDLRANNIMIKVSYKGKGIAEPVEVNVVDMEWSGGVGFAYYPADRNEKVGYPGEAGGLIGVEDDMTMIKMWKRGVNGHTNH
ncbi:hypothetical protein GALMADRAFT_148731 [Galerina marginata CBS 339.88]|uniref:Uncharacterized protein n=1 Tax=Galerina marginata (strain CBS 339.88) TaxID=685588 RepID=A0A067S684_GALM3|nr:hypothetical protein GALMADRAFT_148731 [Galerina marginata CBS 339.88]